MQGMMQPTQQQQPTQQANSQEAFDLAAGQMIKWLASDEGYQTAMTAMKSDPEKGMAMIIGRLLTMVVQGATFSGKTLSPKVVFQAGIEASRALSALAIKAGILTKENEKQIGEEAFFSGLAMFGQEVSNEAMTDDMRAEYVKLIDVVEQMAQGKGAQA